MRTKKLTSSHIAIVGRGAIATALLVWVSACASISGYPNPPVNADQELASLQSYFSPDVVSNYEKMTDATERRAYRDEITYARLRAYDVEFREFEKALSEQSGTIGLSADLVGLTLNGLGATVGGASAKAALSAASAGVIGAKGAIDKDLFYSKTLPALAAQMEANRLKARATIEQGLAKPDTNYPLELAIVDLGTYERAGSLMGALDAITKDAGQTATDATHDITIARNSAFSAGLKPAVALLDRVKALSNTQALAVAKTMEGYLPSRSAGAQDFVKGIDPNGMRLKDGASAKKVLTAWVIMDDRDSASQKQWSDALDAATK